MSYVEGQQSSVFSDLPGRAKESGVSETQVICLGNEKGGSGKSTTAMHIVVAILKLGKKVGAIDLDARQKSLARYIENRGDWNKRQSLSLALPEVRVVAPSQLENKSEARAEEKAQFEGALRQLSKSCDFIVIDSPGADTHLSRLGHAAADIVITPLNDSFVDLDLIAHVDPETFEIKGPSLYSEMIWESRKQRALSDRHTIDWVLMRNRLSSLDAKNKRRMSDVLEKLAPRTGFRIAPGFGERVIYRELFPNGLTLLDLGDPDSDVQLTMSHVAARQELRDLLVTLNLPGLEKAATAF
jgi:chromosome partitioning protein